MEFLFRALSPILKNKQVKFLVVGDGDLRPILEKFCVEKKIDRNVFFAGVVARNEIKNYYAAADIFVHASLSETQGMVLTEAMYAGLPVVARRATGASSLVLNNASGFLVSENEFTEMVVKLVDDKKLRQKFGETARRIAKLQFTSSVCARKMLEVYESLLDARI
jgi:glycosyltransferase involved in cell wall biosynthesis